MPFILLSRLPTMLQPNKTKLYDLNVCDRGMEQNTTELKAEHESLLLGHTRTHKWLERAVSRRSSHACCLFPPLTVGRPGRGPELWLSSMVENNQLRPKQHCTPCSALVSSMKEGQFLLVYSTAIVFLCLCFSGSEWYGVGKIFQRTIIS